MSKSETPETETVSCNHCGGETFGLIQNEDGRVVGARCRLCGETHIFERDE